MFLTFIISFSLSQPLTEKKHETVVQNVNPKTETNNDNTVSEKLEELVDEVIVNDVVENSTFISNIPRDPSINSLDEAAMQYNMISIAQINSEDCGVPMSIFDNVFINYLNIHFIETN